jgi:hypothetical protein
MSVRSQAEIAEFGDKQLLELVPFAAKLGVEQLFPRRFDGFL